MDKDRKIPLLSLYLGLLYLNQLYHVWKSRGLPTPMIDWMPESRTLKLRKIL